MDSPTAPVCPICKQIDQAQSVKTIYSGGSTTIEYAPPGAIIGTSTANFKTLLAQRIKPPDKPVEPKFGDFRKFFIIAGGMFFGYFLSLMTPVLAVMIIVAPVVMWRYYSSRVFKPALKKYQQDYPVWEKAANRWLQLYYCSRDDCVFDPSTGEHVTPDGMNKLLYRAPANMGEAGAPSGGAGDVCFDVMIVDPGPKKIETIKAIRALTNFGLVEAKQMAETPNSVVLKSVSMDTAEQAQLLLEKAGAKVKVI